MKTETKFYHISKWVIDRSIKRSGIEWVIDYHLDLLNSHDIFIRNVSILYVWEALEYCRLKLINN